MKLSIAASSLVLSASYTHVDVWGAEMERIVLELAKECNSQYGPLEFVLLEDEAVTAAVEDDIREDLAKLGFDVQARYLSKVSYHHIRFSDRATADQSILILN